MWNYHSLTHSLTPSLKNNWFQSKKVHIAPDFLCGTTMCIFLKKMAKICHSYPQHWQKESSTAYITITITIYGVAMPPIVNRLRGWDGMSGKCWMATNCEVMTKLGRNWQRSDCATSVTKWTNVTMLQLRHQRRCTWSYNPRRLFPPVTTFSISIVENLEHGVGFGGRGWFSKSLGTKTLPSRKKWAF